MMEQVRGVVLPSPTVFLEDGRVDERLMRELTDWFLACGVHAFFVLGSYGQGPAKPLSLDAYDELRDLFTELKIISKPAKAMGA